MRVRHSTSIDRYYYILDVEGTGVSTLRPSYRSRSFISFCTSTSILGGKISGPYQIDRKKSYFSDCLNSTSKQRLAAKDKHYIWLKLTLAQSRIS